MTTQGPMTFLTDLGSSYGTATWGASGHGSFSEALNKEKLEAKNPVELVNNARPRGLGADCP